jgi:hypothetical protein
MNDIKEMMEKVQKPTRDQLEANIKISHNWITAIRAGNYGGKDVLHIATLLDFLQNQHNNAVKDFEAQFPPAAAPQWEKPQAVAHE